MSHAAVYSRAHVGIHAPQVRVEAHITQGIPGFSLVGLPETAVKESKDRVRAAIINAQFEFPACRITVNLSPADLRKSGSHYDLAIAISILLATQQLKTTNIEQYEFLGELALSGDVLPGRGTLACAVATHRANRTLITAENSLAEAQLCEGLTILPVRHLLEISEHLMGVRTLALSHGRAPKNATQTQQHDMSEVQGQVGARRCLEVAATGGHSLLMSGPPGTGKSMLASRLPGILPPPTTNEALDIAMMASVSHTFSAHQWGQRPFRAPHHTASAAALAGGGSLPSPGEISRAHHGVLFLDELPEFNRGALETLREPLETRQITISRSARQTTFPANFQLIAAMNPCPCGYAEDGSRPCYCTPEQIQRYKMRISGPILDRIDLHIRLQPLPISTLITPKPMSAESSQTIQARVTQGRQRQHARQNCMNALLQGAALEQHCLLDKAGKKLVSRALQQMQLSARAYHKLLRVARTLADMSGVEQIAPVHVQEALSYRLT